MVGCGASSSSSRGVTAQSSEGISRCDAHFCLLFGTIGPVSAQSLTCQWSARPEQKSLVILTPLAYPSLFSSLVAFIAPLYFAHGQPVLEQACREISAWCVKTQSSRSEDEGLTRLALLRISPQARPDTGHDGRAAAPG